MGKYKTIDAYIADQPQKQAARLRELKAAILKAVPGATETFNYGVPAFSLVKNAKAEQQILMGSFKNHVGLYPHPTTMEEFEEELAGFKKGKGSV